MHRGSVALLSAAALIVVTISGSLVGCKREPPAPRIVSAELQVFGADGNYRQAVNLTPETPVTLAQGEYVVAQWTRYTGKAGGGTLRLKDGQLVAENLDVRKEN